MRFHSKESDAPQQTRTEKKKDRRIVLTPSTLVLATYVFLLLTKLLDVAFINR